MRLTQVVVPDGRNSVIKDTERYKAHSTKVDQQPDVTRVEGSQVRPAKVEGGKVHLPAVEFLSGSLHAIWLAQFSE